MSPSCWVRTSDEPRELTRGATLSEQTPDGDTRRWATTAARAADDKQARDVVVLDVGEVLALCEWFVIASAANERQVKAICDEIETQLREQHALKPRRVEGLSDRQWVLMDYGDIVVHVFQQEQREFYDLDRLWKDVPRLEWEDAAVTGGAAAAEHPR
jgi:ribosome-associated protein